MSYTEKINAIKNEMIEKIAENILNLGGKHSMVDIEFQDGIECTTYADNVTNENISIWGISSDTDCLEDTKVVVEDDLFQITDMNVVDLASIADALEDKMFTIIKTNN